jgi:hypothetical protein
MASRIGSLVAAVGLAALTGCGASPPANNAAIQSPEGAPIVREKPGGGVKDGQKVQGRNAAPSKGRAGAID